MCHMEGRTSSSPKCIIRAQDPGSGPIHCKLLISGVIKIHEWNVELLPYPEAIKTKIYFLITPSSKANFKETFHWEYKEWLLKMNLG